MSKFIVKKETFADNFIAPLAKFDLIDKPATVQLKDGNLVGITHSQNQNIILEATLKNIKGDPYSPVIYKDLHKLQSALGFIETSILTFEVKENHLLYDDDFLRFKSFFLDQRFFDGRIHTKVKKIRELDYNIKFTLDQNSISKIRKTKSFVDKDLKHVYFFADSGGVWVSRHDGNRNVDSIKFVIQGSYDGKSFSEIPLDISFFDLLAEKNLNVSVAIDTNTGMFSFEVDAEDYSLKYALAALVKK